MAHPLSTAQSCINAIRQQTDSVVLFCSLGKDSLVALDLVAPHFKRVVCVFMYFVQGLEHIDKYARWIKAKYPNVEWIEIPHWALSNVYKTGTYCTPEPKTKIRTLRHVIDQIREETGLEIVILGMKRADSINRRVMMGRLKEQNYISKGLAYPLAEWTQKEILAYMRQKALPMPIRYSANASGGVGFNLECLLWMRQNAPEDLRRFFNVFPLAERILFDYDRKEESS